MRYVIEFLCLWVLMFVSFMAGAYLQSIPNAPAVKPLTPISYCWAKDHGLYLPCMYSKKVYSA